MSKKLKPCPFCGKKASIQDCSYSGKIPAWCVVCDNPKCFAYTEAFKIKKEAVERWNNRPAEEALQKRIVELEKEKSELLAKCEKYECEIGLAKQQIAALESKSNMYIDLSVAMASTARKVDGLEKERDRMREVLTEAVEKYGKPGGPWNIPGEPGSWIAKARKALEGAGE